MTKNSLLAILFLTINQTSYFYSFPILLARYSRDVITNKTQKTQYIDIIGDYCPANERDIKENCTPQQKCSTLLFNQSLAFLEGPQVIIETEYPILSCCECNVGYTKPGELCKFCDPDRSIPNMIKQLTPKYHIKIRPISSDKQNGNGSLVSLESCEPSLSHLENSNYSENILPSDGIYLCNLQNSLNTALEKKESNQYFNVIHKHEILDRLWEIASMPRTHRIIYTTIGRAEEMAAHLEKLHFKKRSEKRSIKTPLDSEHVSSFINKPEFLLFEDLEAIEFQKIHV